MTLQEEGFRLEMQGLLAQVLIERAETLYPDKKLPLADLQKVNDWIHQRLKEVRKQHVRR